MKRIISFYKFSFIVFLGLLSVFKSVGQRQTYDEIIENLSRLTNEQAYSRLFEHQSQNPLIANIYIQIGHLSEKIVKERDPFRELNVVHYYIDNAILFYELFPIYLQSNDLRRNRQQYLNIPIETSGFSLTNEGVLDYIKSRVKYCKELKEMLTKTYNSLEKSKDHYNNCVRIFNSINNDYDNYNEVLLKTNPGFISLLNELEREFNATIKEFDQYKSQLKQFPIAAYNQQYKLLPIKTFRLDGITNSDFLKETFYLWNYGEWVTQFKEIYEKEIVVLRKDIEDIQNTFDDNLRLLSSIDYAEADLNLKSFDELFLFKLGRFDSNSLIRELFNYHDKRQNFLHLAKNSLNNQSDSNSLMMNRKLRYYYRLALELNNTKKELENFNNAINSEGIIRFNDFFNRYYQGESGLQNYFVNQGALLDNSFHNALDNLKTYLGNEIALKRKYSTIIDKSGNPIPLFGYAPEDDQERSSYFVEDIFYFQDMPAFVSGHLKKTDIIVPFVAKITQDQSIEWVVEIDSHSEEESHLKRNVSKIFAYEQGVIAIVTSDLYEDNAFLPNSEKMYQNRLIHLDNLGEIVYSGNMHNKNLPIYLHYDEINQLTYLGFGEKDNQNPNSFTSISICQADSTGIINWETDFNVNGNFVGMVRAEDKYIALFNFQNYEINGDYRQTGNNGKNWATLMTEISNRGKITKTIPVVAQESIYIDRVFSISSNEINLIGYSGKPPEKTGKLKYMVFSTSGTPIFSNIEF